MELFTENHGFQLDCIFPADDPETIDISSKGRRIRLVEQDNGPYPDYVRIGNGEEIGSTESVELNPPIDLPPKESKFELTRISEKSPWVLGRVGMRYRNLLFNQNGRFGASHIQIPKGGAVNDYVHYHRVKFQIIYLYKGWVKLVYEDQGEPFIMNEGDCILQPPGIRHRVLESSSPLEVVEVNSPAKHMTGRDHGLELPTGKKDPGRLFGGQKFVHYKYAPNDSNEFGVHAAMNGGMSVRTLYPKEKFSRKNDSPFMFHFILKGNCNLDYDGENNLIEGDNYVVPDGGEISLYDCSEDLKILEVKEENI